MPKTVPNGIEWDRIYIRFNVCRKTFEDTIRITDLVHELLTD